MTGLILSQSAGCIAQVPKHLQTHFMTNLNRPVIKTHTFDIDSGLLN